MKRDLNGIFERMVSDMCGLAAEDALLDSCMELDAAAMRYIPLRYRIIALGFVKHFTLEKLNATLAQQGCPRLYSRNFWEATLIFAFLNAYSFEEWKCLRPRFFEIYASVEDNGWFRESKITYDELERYVLQNSETCGDQIATMRHTEHIERGLASLGSDVEAFCAFLRENVRSFSSVREKTRYYFCKYLYYNLNARIENYFAALRKNSGVDAALAELMPLKVVTKLRRGKQMPEEKKRELIQTSAISCGEIFDEFNFFYFDYVSVDWVEVLIECYERVEQIPPTQKKRIADIFRKGRPELSRLSDDEVIRLRMEEIERMRDEAHSLDGKHGYGRNRAGEHAVYKYIRGGLDIDRTALICFLLFFSGSARLPRERRVTLGRMREILLQCGYAPLDIESDFDWFVAEFLESRRPMELLTQVMAEYAKHSENSFLYHLYGNSTNYMRELVDVMVRSEA